MSCRILLHTCGINMYKVNISLASWTDVALFECSATYDSKICKYSCQIFVGIQLELFCALKIENISVVSLLYKILLKYKLY